MIQKYFQYFRKKKEKELYCRLIAVAIAIDQWKKPKELEMAVELLSNNKMFKKNEQEKYYNLIDTKATLLINHPIKINKEVVDVVNKILEYKKMEWASDVKKVFLSDNNYHDSERNLFIKLIELNEELKELGE